MEIKEGNEKRSVELTVQDIYYIRLALSERIEHYRGLIRKVWETEQPKEAVKRDMQLTEFANGFRWALKSLTDSEKKEP